ncbi:FAD-dependent oxidoreductase [Halomonas sp. MC140]|nr:FAD-dependent oxidoreductase [Halomonas sp. MC140]MDN7130935.1 FAD-dependent oxidoreductase [Halomonas sp. MC140]
MVTREPGILIVGAGLAGWSIVEAVRELDTEVPITLVTACRGDRYHKPELSVALSRGQTPDQLVREKGVEAAQRLGVRLMADTFVVGGNAEQHQLRTTRGTLPYTQLILAQGARPALPDSLPADVCWRVNDLMGWSGLQSKLADGTQRVVLVGAGMVGCELAEDMAKAGHQVTLLSRSSYPLATLLPEAAGHRLLKSFEALGVAYRGSVSVESVEVTAIGERRLHLNNGDIVIADHVVAATGLATDTRLARLAGLDFERGILVDAETLQTSKESIYALGDCASFGGIPCRFIEPLPAQAEAIARNILGHDISPYRHKAPIIRLKTRNLPIELHGTPDRNISWQIDHDDNGILIMSQFRNGQRLAHLTVGSPSQEVA